jgi:hypothetical protein
MEAFLLGLSNGAVCLAYCAPVLVPCLLGTGAAVRGNAAIVAEFLAGRLMGYLLFGVITWAISRSILREPGYREMIIGASYLVLSVMLVAFGFFNCFHQCTVQNVGSFVQKLSGNKPELSFLMPFVAGLAMGLNFCPPFLLAMAASTAEGSLLYSLLFFFMFFVGTSLFFIPAPFLGLLKTFPALAMVGKLASGIVGLYYFYSGAILLAGGIKSL